MRIVLATEFFPTSAAGEITGGVESRAFSIAAELATRNEVYVITSRQPGSKRESSFLGIKILRVGPAYPYTQTGHLLERILFSLAACSKAGQLIAREKIDIVDGYNFLTYPVPLFALGNGIKRYLTYHEVWIGSWAKNTDKRGMLGELSERIILLLARLEKTQIISVSDFTKQALIRNRIPKERIEVIHNGVKLSNYSRIRVAKERNPTVCFVGRLTKNKRVEELISAIPLARREIPTIKCLIIGSGPEEQNLKKLASSLGLEKDVRFLGFLKTHEQVLKKLRASHIFCSPSLVEGFGITLVEAISSGVPFVCSDIAPFREISQGKGGLHFRSESHKDLASKLVKLLKNKRLYQRCVEEEKHLAQGFDWSRLAKNIEGIYRR
jgi:glycosyltransferase involved in cell wall biosynthesis